MYCFTRKANCFTRKVNCFTRNDKCFTRKTLHIDPFDHKLQTTFINVTTFYA